MDQALLSNHQLTPRQLQLLKAIALTQARQPYSATIQELACQLQVSRTTAFEHLAALREKGFVQALPNKARSLKLTTQGQRLLKNSKPAEATVQIENGLPLVGRVAAGRPIEAIETNDKLTLDQFGTTDSVFALQVTGDSMIDENIFDGDYVICRRTQTAQNGQLVIAIVEDDTATLKRFYKEDGRIRLQPSNPDYQPIYTDRCRIEGTVIGLLRKF